MMRAANFFPLLFCLLATSLFSQSNINQSLSVNGTGSTADPSAQLDVSATDKGMLIPRLTSAQRNLIASPATGLLVFDTDTGSFWFFGGANWTELKSDNLGNHTATQNIATNGNWISNDGDSEGVFPAPTGDVGIGTANPGADLHVVGDPTSATLMLAPNEGFSGGNSTLNLMEDDDGTYGMLLNYNGNDNQFRVYGKADASITGPHLSINRDDGYIGVGTANPADRLTVQGNIRMVDGNQQNGYVMTSDASGKASWAPFANPNTVAFHASASLDQTVFALSYDTLRCANTSASENFEFPDGVFDNSLFSFVAPVSGYYYFQAAVLWENVPDAVRCGIFIRLNNTDEVGSWAMPSLSNDYFTCQISSVLQLLAGDGVLIRIYNGDSANRDTFSQTGKYCWFSGFKIF